MRRRGVLWLVAGGGASLLAACTAVPTAVPPGPTAAGAAPAGPTAAGAAPAGPTAAGAAPAGPTAAGAAPAAAQPTTPPLATTGAAVPPTAVPPTAGPTTSPPTPAAAPPTLAPTPTPPPALAAAVASAMQAAIERGALPGGVALVQHRGARLLHAAYGLSHKYDSRTALTAEPTPATTETRYDLASLTKLFVTTALMRLVEDGRLALDEPVAGWVPEFAAGGKADVTLRQLLTHTSGLPALLQLWKLADSPAARIRRALGAALLDPPDTVFRYSDLGPIAFGHLLERVTRVSLDTLVRATVTEPLGLRQTGFRPASTLKPRIAPTEDEQAVGRGLVWGEVHDENSWSLGGVAGHAGMFGTAADLAAFGEMYLRGGTLGGTRVLRADTVTEMTRNQIGRLGWRGLGWELNESYYMGRLAAPQTFGHTGFTGTSLVVDPRRELIVVLLTNRVHPTREGPSINATRQAVANAALAAAA